MKDENTDLNQSVEYHSEFAETTDENYEEQGFLWMCGICEGAATFETIYDLFNHKKEKGHILQAKKRTEVTNCNTNSNTPPSPEVFGSCETDTALVDPKSDEVNEAKPKPDVSPPSPASSDDVPLASLTHIISAEKKKNSKQLNETTNDDTDIKPEISEGLSNTVKTPEKVAEIFKDETDVFNDLENENDLEDSSTDEFKDVDEKKECKFKSSAPMCKICNTEFRSRFLLTAHKKTHLYKDTGCYKCETCGKMCPKYDNFTRHLTIHLENREKSHQCSYCVASFYNLADLKRHLVLHSAVKPYTCKHCGEGFTKEDSLLIHAYKHTGVLFMKYACKDCNKVLNSQSALVMHVKTHSVKTVFCPEQDCKFSCYLQSQLRQHMRKHSGEKPFQCAKCGRCFSRSNDMKNHVLNVHEGVRPFKCPACPKQFALVGNLRIHFMTHTNERPYLCAQCGKSFNHPSTLRKHSVTVHSPWRDQNKQTRSKKLSSPNSQLSQKTMDIKKSKGKKKEVLAKDSGT